MAKIFLHYTCCLIVLTTCVDQGVGRWRKKNRVEKIQREVDFLERMAEKIEHEIGDLYEDYPKAEMKQDDIEKRNQQQYLSGSLYLKKNGFNTFKENFNRNSDLFVTIPNVTTTAKTTQEVHHSMDMNNTKIFHVPIGNKGLIKFKSKKEPNWPKFDDLLSSIGKKYDWKNDRWIKVKRKLKSKPSEASETENSINFHEKHKFSYSPVKLNRSKSRRNVVIAVTAVR